MSDWAGLEQSMVGSLGGMQQQGESILASVTACSPLDRAGLRELLARERMPAAYVMVTGRTGGRGADRPGVTTAKVILAGRSYRGLNEARVGGQEAHGLWEIAGQTARTLHGQELEGGWRFRLVGEQALPSDGAMLLWEQTYEVYAAGGANPPTFGGVALAGLAGRVVVEIGECRQSLAEFGFAGLEGRFARLLGPQSRQVVWKGDLRAVDDAGVDSLEAAIESVVRAGTSGALVDEHGRALGEGVAVSFERTASRGRDELTGEAVQPFVLRFVQLTW